MSIIVPIILALASIGLFFGYIDPTYTKIKEARVEKADYTRALDNSEQLRAERDKLLSKFNGMSQADLDRLEKLLPNDIDNIRLVIDIDEMARTYGMRIRNFKADAADKSDKIGRDATSYGTLTLSFSTTASYQTFLAFMRDLERSLRILDVTAISFSAPESGSGLYDYAVTVKTYWLK
jgi:Tfp pilus assembly protein PilO